MCFIFNPLACQCSGDGTGNPRWSGGRPCTRSLPMCEGNHRPVQMMGARRHSRMAALHVVGSVHLDSWALSWELSAQKTQVPVGPLWITVHAHLLDPPPVAAGHRWESGSRGVQETPLRSGPAIVLPSPLVGEGQGGLCGCLEVVALLHCLAWLWWLSDKLISRRFDGNTF